MARKELSPAAKETARKYDNIHYSVIGCKLPRAVADNFRDHCKQQGVSVSAALARYVYSVLQIERAAVPVDPAGVVPTDQDDFPAVVTLDQSPAAVKLSDCHAVGDVSATAAVTAAEMSEYAKNGGDQAETTRPEPCGHPDSPSDCTNSQDFPAHPVPGGSRARPGVGNSRVPVVPRDNVPPAVPASPAPDQDQTQAQAQPSTRTYTGNRRTPTHPQVHAPAHTPTPREKTAPGNPPAEGPREDDPA